MNVVETLDNGDYITLEKDCVCIDWCTIPFCHQIKEIYTRFSKEDKFICSWWVYITR